MRTHDVRMNERRERSKSGEMIITPAAKLTELLEKPLERSVPGTSIRDIREANSEIIAGG